MKLEDRIGKELLRIAHENGVLRAEDVVDAARSAKSPLHSCFDWDDTAAAKKWRLTQARQLIRCHVVVLDDKKKPVRAFVSLKPDRVGNGGYRNVHDVFDDEDLRQQMIADALDDLRIVQLRYAELKELAGVWAEIARVESKHKKPARAKAKGGGEARASA